MLDRIRLVVATPCFGGQVSSIYASSLFALQSALRGESDFDLKVHLCDGDVLITHRFDHVGPFVFHSDIASQFGQAPAADAA